MAVARQIIDRETIKSTFSRPRGNPASTRRCDGLLGELGANCFHGFCADPFLFATAPISRIVDCALRDLRCKCTSIFWIKITEVDAFSGTTTGVQGKKIIILYVEHISCVNFEIAAASWKASKTMSATRLRETITECLADVQSDSVDAQRKALQTLASLTKVSPQNRSLLAQTDGVVSTLLTLTKISSSIIRILALSILFNLSLNPDLKWNLADMETIHHLNSIILSTSSPEINRLVCSLICSLAMLDKNKAKFGVAGTVQVLVGAISGPRCPASHHLLSSLAELVQFHGNCTVAVRSGAVQVLLGVVESTDGEDLAGTSLAVLERCMLSKEGAAEILLRLFDESEGCVRDAFRLPEFSSVLADISVRGSSKAREKANQLLKKMVDANLDPYTDGNSLFLPWYQ
ncbi:hypothetical protein H0E87_011772 [Populus deltoides]|uniref:ARM repeat superfamily protein n=1 Tax=Populus deltoides TaxID=3696 RepID=A0A8T2YGC6_POPDE|nr:hypothetical protein H0E87_011772 [Populus deltoides]